MKVREEIFGTVFYVAQHLARHADEALAPLGLTSKQWLLLAVLAKRFPGQAPTLSEAARWYGCSRQNVKQLALGLEELGYLKVRPDPDDRRALRLHVTEKVAVFDSPSEKKRQEKLMELLFLGFGGGDLKQLAVLLRRWAEVLNPA